MCFYWENITSTLLPWKHLKDNNVPFDTYNSPSVEMKRKIFYLTTFTLHSVFPLVCSQETNKKLDCNTENRWWCFASTETVKPNKGFKILCSVVKHYHSNKPQSTLRKMYNKTTIIHQTENLLIQIKRARPNPLELSVTSNTVWINLSESQMYIFWLSASIFCYTTINNPFEK